MHYNMEAAPAFSRVRWQDRPARHSSERRRERRGILECLYSIQRRPV